MKNKVQISGGVIFYSVTKSNRRKTSAIIVDANGIEVKVSITKSDAEIKKMVLGKQEWILKKQQEFTDRGKTHPRTKPKTVEYLETRTQRLAAKVGVKPNRIVIKNMKARWGSSTKSGTIVLNRAITNAPSRIIDYIILHELCHLKVRDHSRRFWNMLYVYDKNFENNKKWLEENGHLLLQ